MNRICLLPTVYCLLTTAYCLLPTAYCLLPTAYSAPAEPAPAPDARPGPAAEEFKRIFTRWKKLVGELSVLQVEYTEANRQQQAEIRKQWDRLTKQGHEMMPKLYDAAEKAYAEAPNTDEGITELLVGRLVGMVQADRFNAAYQLGKLLAENECSEEIVYDTYGVAAFAVNDFDAAEKYLKLAQKSKVISRSGSEYLRYVPECKEAWAKEQEIRRAEAEADDLPRVLLKTNRGEIELELFENEAPNTVANFISLVKKGYYNGLTFHRVRPAFMAQTGCPDGTGGGGPGYTIPCECYKAEYRRHFGGSLSMAKEEPRDTGGSQFFIAFRPTAHLNGKHTVFGRVVKGLDVLPKITRRNPNDAMTGKTLPEPDTIIEAKVLRDRGHEYVPKKIGE